MVHASVATFAVPESAKARATEVIALITTEIKAKSPIAMYLPRSKRIRRGSRTKRLLKVPYVYSWAVCAAKTQSATSPSKPDELLNASEIPLGSARTSLVILTPRSALPISESIKRNSRETIKAVTATTTPILPKKRVGRRSLRHSARKILIALPPS